VDDGESGGMWSGPLGRWLDARGVREGGYRWTEDGEYEADDPVERALGEPPRSWGPWLVPVRDDRPPRLRPVDVLNDPHRRGFHRTFARLADGRDESRMRRVQQFANRYGLLDDQSLYWLVRTSASSTGPSEVQGESWETWEQAIFETAAVVKLWDAVKARRTGELTPLVTWSGPPFAFLHCVYRNGRLVTPNSADAEGVAWAVGEDLRLDEYASDGEHAGVWPGDPIEAARQAVYQQIARNLDGKVTPILLRGTTPDLWLRPRSLLAAAYVHLAYAVSGRSRAPVECANPRCGRFFEPEHGAQRYCDDRCRKLAHYHRSKNSGSADDTDSRTPG
jgi:hypothetical protein